MSNKKSTVYVVDFKAKKLARKHVTEREHVEVPDRATAKTCAKCQGITEENFNTCVCEYLDGEEWSTL